MKLLQQHTIQRYFTALSRVACIAVTIRSEYEYEVSLLLCEYNNGALSVKQEAQSFTSIEDASQKIPTHMPIVMHIDGKGIISRFVQDSSLSQQEILELFPDFAGESFVSDVMFIPEGACVSFARKQIVDEIIQKIHLSHRLLHVYLGAGVYSVACIWEQYNAFVAHIPGWQFLCDSSGIVTSIEKKNSLPKEHVLRFMDKEISSNYLSLYMLATYAFQKDFLYDHSPQYLHNKKQDYFFRYISKKVALLSIVFVLVGLIINTLVFSSSYAQHQDLTDFAVAHTNVLQELHQLEDELSRKTVFFEDISQSSKKNYAFYFDQIAVSLPRDIMLEKAVCNPLRKDIKQGTEIDIESGVFIIYGVSKQISTVHTWIQNLKKMTWVIDAQLLDYSNTAGSSGAQCIIKINY